MDRGNCIVGRVNAQAAIARRASTSTVFWRKLSEQELVFGSNTAVLKRGLRAFPGETPKNQVDRPSALPSACILWFSLRHVQRGPSRYAAEPSDEFPPSKANAHLLFPRPCEGALSSENRTPQASGPYLQEGGPPSRPRRLVLCDAFMCRVVVMYMLSCMPLAAASKSFFIWRRMGQYRGLYRPLHTTRCTADSPQWVRSGLYVEGRKTPRGASRGGATCR
jgi:hypothetical protein